MTRLHHSALLQRCLRHPIVLEWWWANNAAVHCTCARLSRHPTSQMKQGKTSVVSNHMQSTGVSARCTHRQPTATGQHTGPGPAKTPQACCGAYRINGTHQPVQPADPHHCLHIAYNCSSCRYKDMSCSWCSPHSAVFVLCVIYRLHDHHTHQNHHQPDALSTCTCMYMPACHPWPAVGAQHIGPSFNSSTRLVVRITLLLSCDNHAMYFPLTVPAAHAVL